MSYSTVRLIGLEPTQLALLDPKSSASTNFATGAVVECVAPFNFAGAKLVIFFELQNKKWNDSEKIPKSGFFSSIMTIFARILTTDCRWHSQAFITMCIVFLKKVAKF